MAYELYIADKHPFGDDEIQPITEDAWQTVKESEDYQVIEFIEGKNPNTGEIIKMNTPNSVKHSELGVIISYRDGYLKTLHDEKALPELQKLATKLNRNVFGEEGETY